MEDKNYRIVLTLPERLRESLKESSKKKALSVNALIRVIVAEYLEKEIQKTNG